MTRKQILVVAAVFGLAFASNGILRGDVAPGVVGGALGAVLIFVVLIRVQEQHAARRRRDPE